MKSASAMSCFLVATLSLATVDTGCSSYAVPGRGAEMSLLGMEQTDHAVQAALDKRPLASLPTSIAPVRVEQSGYRSETTESYGRGNYSVVTTRDIEAPEQIARLEHLPMVRGLAPIGRMLLPYDLNSDRELRQAAAELHADMLLIYTLDTTFVVDDKAVPLTVITLGLSPNQQARVVCTASAVLMDTRNGYVYGIAEAAAKQSQLADAWTSGNAVDETRRRTEGEAFGKLVGELQKTWTGVMRTMQSPPVEDHAAAE
jgi:hypothetical protein